MQSLWLLGEMLLGLVKVLRASSFKLRDEHNPYKVFAGRQNSFLMDNHNQPNS
jgi:hypothetical protein